MDGEAGDVPQPVSRSPLVSSRSVRTTAVLGAPLVVLTGASVVGNLLAPDLLTAHPLLLVALAPRTLYLAAAAGQVPFVAFVGVALLRLCAADPSHFLLGRLHGPWAAAALDRRRPRRRWRVRRPARQRRLARLWDRLGLVLVALSPTGKILVLAGASRLTHRQVASAAVAGTLVQVVLLYVAGRAVSGTVEAGAGVMAAWAPAAVVATGGVMAGAAVIGRPRRGRSAGLAVGFGDGQLQAPPEDLLSGRLRRAPQSSIWRLPVTATSTRTREASTSTSREATVPVGLKSKPSAMRRMEPRSRAPTRNAFRKSNGR